MGGAQVDGRMLGNILVTHLHAYATPFIRYEIGDLGVLSPRCKCGHDGPVLSHLVGRGKSLVKHGDGHLTVGCGTLPIGCDATGKVRDGGGGSLFGSPQ